MNLLASLIPGVRHVRTPIIVGALWLAIAYVAFIDVWGEWVADSEGLGRIERGLGALPESLALAALGLGTYLLGSVMTDLSAGLGRWLRGRVETLTSWARDWGEFGKDAPRVKRRVWKWGWAVDRHLEELTRDIRAPILDAVAAVYAKAGARSGAHFTFPAEVVYEKLDSTALQLWQAAPDQYQEYDRLRAEAEFRAGIVPPLLAAAGLVGPTVAWWLAAIVVIAAVVLGRQARRARQRGKEMVATSIYHGAITVPLLVAVEERLKASGLPPSAGEGQWAAATVLSLEALGEYDAAHVAFDRFVDGEYLADEDAGIQEFRTYLGEQESDLAKLFERERDRAVGERE